MTRLSYSTMNALINEPHTWLCKQMGLKTYSNKYFESGKIAHQVIQKHCSGEIPMALLEKIPKFSVVETVDFDENCKITLRYNDKYEITGFFDGFNPETGDLLEIKSGKSWSPTDFSRLVQWKIYALAKPEVKKVWLVNVPGKAEDWNDKTIKVFKTEVTQNDLEDAKKFIDKAISTIENIQDVFDTNSQLTQRSKWCYYIDCPWCPEREI